MRRTQTPEDNEEIRPVLTHSDRMTEEGTDGTHLRLCCSMLGRDFDKGLDSGHTGSELLSVF